MKSISDLVRMEKNKYAETEACQLMSRMIQFNQREVAMIYISHLESEMPKQTEADKSAMYKLLTEMGFDLEPPKKVCPENEKTESNHHPGPA